MKENIKMIEKEEGYGLKKGEVVQFKCEVVSILPGCTILVKGRNIGEDSISFECHVNSLKKEES